MNRLVILAGVILMLIGMLVEVPLVMGSLRYTHATGIIKDVFIEPVGPDQARLQVVFEFTVAGREAKTTFTSRGGNLVDERFRPIEDPVYPTHDAEKVRHRLMGDDPQYRQTRTVHYLSQDPAGTAVIVADAPDGPSRRYEAGLVLLACGAVALLFGRPRGRKET